MAIFSTSTIKRCHPAFGEDAGRADAFDIESFVQSELAAPAFLVRMQMWLTQSATSASSLK